MMFCAELIRKCFDSYDSGAWREVYVTPDRKYVIKFDRRPPRADLRGCNLTEYTTYEYFLDHPEELPDGVRIPKMWFDGTTIIAEFITGVPISPCYNGVHFCNKPKKCPRLKLDKTPINDLNGNNILLDSDGIVWVIDLGNGSNLIGMS
jgi:hypothetical protein